MAQSLQLQFIDEKYMARLCKTMVVKRRFMSKTGPLGILRDFYFGPVHHKIVRILYVSCLALKMVK